MTYCTFSGCARKHEAKGLCIAHYAQKYTRGQPLKPLRVMGKWTLESLLAQAVPNGDCLDWKRKYGSVTLHGKVIGAHHAAYRLATGADTTGRQVHHKCANNLCVNPDHLELASNAENTLEMFARKDYEARIAVLEARVKELEAQIDHERSVMT